MGRMLRSVDIGSGGGVGVVGGVLGVGGCGHGGNGVMGVTASKIKAARSHFCRMLGEYEYANHIYIYDIYTQISAAHRELILRGRDFVQCNVPGISAGLGGTDVQQKPIGFSFDHLRNSSVDILGGQWNRIEAKEKDYTLKEKISGIYTATNHHWP